MCGITGFIDTSQKSSQEILQEMTDSMTHRGPDGSGFELINLNNAQIGFGHRRLSIIDLSESGKQPMLFDSLMITFNGEIYNYAEIRKTLEEKGHVFTSGSDTEVILHAYTEWGEKCLEHFIGMFAFVIVNNDNGDVFCARDRAGVKPFYYYYQSGLFLFASELKAFHKHPGFVKQIDLNAVGAYMQYGSVPTPHCIFSHCYKIRPGHYVKFNAKDIAESKPLKQEQYWNVYDAYNAEKLMISYEEAMTQTEDLLQSAFNYRMVSDVPVGVFLSGGFDSTCVTSILQESSSTPLKTFTIGVPDIGLNEAPCAKDIAKHIGTEHTEYTCTEKEVLDLIPNLPFYFDEPFADSSAIPTTLVSKIAREQVTVALSADAGDEIFAGYNRYDYMLRYGNKLRRIPGFVGRSMSGMMNVIPSDKIPVLRNKYNFHNRYEKLKGLLKDPSSEHIMLSLSQQWTDDQMRSMLREGYDPFDTYYQSKELKDSTPLAYMMAIDYQTYLIDDILQKVDRSTMSQSLEGREPFLDHRIIEFAARLPDEYKYKDGIKKRILRDIVYKRVPQKLLDRPKMGFAIPIGKWLLTDLKKIVDEYISEEVIVKQGIFEWKEIDDLKRRFYGGRKEYDAKIWYLLMFQMWYAKWMK